MGTPVFTKERAQDCFGEVRDLLQAHWEEITAYKDIPLDPDWDVYVTAENNGNLRAYVLRVDGAIQGYGVFFVRPNIHYKGSLQAVQDIVYITPAYRMVGIAFLSWCDQQLADEGVQVVYHHVKLAHNFGPLLARLGYEQIEAVWAKRLDKEA